MWASATCRWFRSRTPSAPDRRTRTSREPSTTASRRTCTAAHRKRAAAISPFSAASPGETSRPRHRHRARGGNSAQDCGKGRPRRCGLFREEIEPLLNDGGVEFIGEINDHQKSAIPGSTRGALLFPIDWPEPFGLSMIEAMACGTPVLAFRCGSVPEIIEDGITGADRRNHGRGDRRPPGCHCARSTKGASPFRATFFRHTNGEGLCWYIPVAAGAVPSA